VVIHITVQSTEERWENKERPRRCGNTGRCGDIRKMRRHQEDEETSGRYGDIRKMRRHQEDTETSGR